MDCKGRFSDLPITFIADWSRCPIFYFGWKGRLPYQAETPWVYSGSTVFAGDENTGNQHEPPNWKGFQDGCRDTCRSWLGWFSFPHGYTQWSMIPYWFRAQHHFLCLLNVNGEVILITPLNKTLYFRKKWWGDSVLILKAQDGSVVWELKNKIIWVAADTKICLQSKKMWWANTALGCTSADPSESPIAF